MGTFQGKQLCIFILPPKRGKEFAPLEAIFVTWQMPRGTTAMTLARPCVHPSFRNLVPATPPTSSAGVIWNFVDRFLMIWYEDVHVVVYFCLGHFWWSYGPCWLRPCPRNSCHIFDWIDLKLCRMFHHDLKMCMWFWGFHCHTFDIVMALLSFFQLLNHLTERADFWSVISIWFINYSDYS